MSKAKYNVRLLLGILAGSAAVVAGASYLDSRAFRPPPSVIATFASPDRQFRLAVIETRPQGFMQASPYLYDLSLGRPGGSPFAGKPLEINNDSAPIAASDFKVTWSVGAVTVDHGTPPDRATAEFAQGSQDWRAPR